jgi:ketosteroid isomerase-like protein
MVMPEPAHPIARDRAGISFLVLVGILVAIALFALDSRTAPARAASPEEVAAHMAAVDRARAHGLATARSAAERELIQADLDFAADARNRHVSEAFRDRFGLDGILIGPDEPVAFGRDAAFRSMQRSRADWHWAPVAARVNGDLGATWGVAAILYRNAAGEQASIQTRYVTVWERRNGRWEMWVDTGNSGPGPTEFPGSAVASARPQE